MVNGRRAVFIVLVCVLGLVVLLVGGTALYHWDRFRGCEDAIRSAQAERSRFPNARPEWEVPFETFTAAQSTELRQSAHRWNQKVDEIVAKGQASTATRVYLVGDMVYFVFYGPGDAIRDFACVSN